MQQYDRKPIIKARESRALSGATETVLERIDYEYTFATVPPQDSALQAKFREFMASVAGGETFTIDPLGTEATPDNPITVQLIPNTYSERREAVLYFSYLFRAREV